jgi:xanthine dehydrogenase accessory factor
MYVFRAIDFSRAMARIGKYLGYRVTVVDARPIFATKQRIPDADEVIVAWPDEDLRTDAPNQRDRRDRRRPADRGGRAEDCVAVR